MTLGQRIQELRKGAGLSQEGLGEALGVSRQAVSKWEGDGGVPELDTLIAMSRLFGVTLGELLGVEEPSSRNGAKAEQAQAAPGISAEEVEAILYRYAEETRWRKEQERRQGLLAVCVLVAFMVATGVWMYRTVKVLNMQVSYLNSQVVSMYGYIDNSIAGISGSIQSVLTEQNNPLNSQNVRVVDFDRSAETVTVEISAQLKTYDADTQAQFVLNWTKTDQTTGQTETGWVSGPNFTATATIPMNYHLEPVIRIRDGGGSVQVQNMGIVYSGMHPYSFQLYARGLLNLMVVSADNWMDSRAEDPYLVIETSHPGIGPNPMSAELVIVQNGREELYRLPVELTDMGGGEWYGHIEGGVVELSLKKGELLTVTLVVTDDRGDTQEIVSRRYVGENPPPSEAPVNKFD